MKTMQPFMRQGVYYFRKRVPRRFASVEPIPIMQLSLHTDSMEVARRKAPEVWNMMLDGWQAKLDGLTAEGEQRLDKARALAERRGERFMHTAEIAAGPLADILRRMDAIPDKPKQADLPIIEAMLGTPAPSGIKVSESFNAFYEVSDDLIHGKSKDQVRRHKAPRLKAINNFVKAVSDKPLREISNEDMFTFRNWLMARVRAGEVQADSANKDMTYLRAMWKKVAQSKGFKMGYDSDGLLLKAPAKPKSAARPTFEDAWIKDHFACKGALAGLNTDARLIVLGMINTGYRPSEGAGLLPEEIRLDANIPHIVIQPNANRSLKNVQSERIIPLTGISLEAFRVAKAGFPRYASNSASLSATVNKFFAENGHLPTERHVLYSLRHSMEDRMLRAKIDERIRKDILGHQIERERYGEGGGMEHVHELLQQIAI